MGTVETGVRRRVRYDVDGTPCVAWHYSGTTGVCIVMAGGIGMIKEPATDRFALRFTEAGHSVLAPDYRHFGESGGEPRQASTLAEQVKDLRAAADHAGTLPDVDAHRVVLWGFSLGGGHVLEVARTCPTLAAAIAQTPMVDGRAAVRLALRSQTTRAFLRLVARGLRDAVGGRLGRAPLLVPLVGARGTVAFLTAPDARQGPAAIDPDGRYPDWRQAAAARCALPLGGYRPGRRAEEVGCPLLVVVARQDQSAPAPAAVRAAERAPRGELVEVDGGHYAPFLDAHEQVVSAELAFVARAAAAA